MMRVDLLQRPDPGARCGRQPARPSARPRSSLARPQASLCATLTWIRSQPGAPSEMLGDSAPLREAELRWGPVLPRSRLDSALMCLTWGLRQMYLGGGGGDKERSLCGGAASYFGIRRHVSWSGVSAVDSCVISSCTVGRPLCLRWARAVNAVDARGDPGVQRSGEELTTWSLFCFPRVAAVLMCSGSLKWWQLRFLGLLPASLEGSGTPAQSVNLTFRLVLGGPGKSFQRLERLCYPMRASAT